MVSHAAGAIILLACAGLRAVAVRTSEEFGEQTLHIANLTHGSILLGRYEIMQQWPAGYEKEKQLGAGQFGAAFLARDTQTEAQVVIKMFMNMNGQFIKAGGVHMPDDQTRLAVAKKECDASAALRNAKDNDDEGKSRFMVCLKDGTAVGADVGADEDAYIVLEAIPGKTLSAWAEEFPMEIPGKETTKIVKMMLQGLAHIEDKFVHCDIKGDNVMVWGSGDDVQLKFIDYGFVSPANEHDENEKGAFQFYPPEKYKDKAYITKASWDLWSVGMTVYQLICGVPALVNDMMGEVLSDEGVKPTDTLLNPNLFSIYPARMKALAEKLENPDTFKDACFNYEDIKEEDPALGNVLDFLLSKVLVKEEERDLASKLLADPIFKD